MCDIIDLKQYITRFKVWNFTTVFKDVKIDKYEDNLIVSVNYKNKEHFLTLYGELLIPEYLRTEAFSFIQKIHSIEKDNKDNFQKYFDMTNDLTLSIINPTKKFDCYTSPKYDLFFFLCITAEFYRQLQFNQNLIRMLPSNINKISQNFLVNAIISNL